MATIMISGVDHMSIQMNENYRNLKDSYLFFHIAQKTKAYLAEHPGERLLRMGIGDVSRPLCPTVIRALHEAVDDQAAQERFHGYMPECGAPFLREAIAEHYRARGIVLADDEVFVSSGASDELGDILDLFDKSAAAMVIEPAYPAYVDANVMAGRRIDMASNSLFCSPVPMRMGAMNTRLCA
jgi:LL-diaminopimelate aminotransferase